MLVGFSAIEVIRSCLGMGKMRGLPASGSPATTQGGGTLLRRHSAAPHRVNSQPGHASSSGHAPATYQGAEGRRPRPRVRVCGSIQRVQAQRC